MSRLEKIVAAPERFDWFDVLRRLERAHPSKPRIGEAETRRDDYALLGQNPGLAFPGANVESVSRIGADRYRVLARFLGLLGPQGPLPLAVTDEAYGWLCADDEAFARFLDLFNHRFQQLFYRAWADSRPIAQHEHPEADRFAVYIGSTVGLGTPSFLGLDRVPDAQKLAHAGLAAPAAKSAVRLEALFRGVLGLEVEIEEFVGSRLRLEAEDRSRLGRLNARLGSDAMLGGSCFSVSDTIRIHVRTRCLADYERVLPVGDHAEAIADLVFFYLGDTLEWELLPALPAREAAPVRLGVSGRVGWTTWLAPPMAAAASMRTDARFDLADRARTRRARE